MPEPHHHPEPPAHRLSTVALLTALAFGCTTIRAPVASLQSPIPVQDGRVAPQLELWLESADPIGPDEAARVSNEARAAIEAALAGREVGDGGTLLVVRAQGVTRSPSHRSDQTAATVGIVLGAVVVVVAVVILIASGKGSSGGSGGGRLAGGGARAPGGGHWGGVAARPPPVSPALPGAARAAPVRLAGAAAVAGRPPPPPRPGPSPWMPTRPPGPVRPPPPPYHHDHGPYFTWGVFIDPGPIVLVPGPPASQPYQVVSSRDLPAPLEVAPGPGEGRVVEAPAPEEGPAEVAQVTLPALPPFPVEERGFFDGDALTLELTLVDRVSGEPRWTKWVEAEVDPLDREEVREVLHRALDEPAGWVAVRPR